MHASDFATAAQGSTADSALQSVKVLGQTLTKTSNEITVAQAKTALGLGSAAYTASTAYATSAQGSTADSALQEVTIAGNKLTKANSTISKETISAALNLTGGEGSFDARIVIAQETADNINIDLATNYKTWSNTKTAIQGNTDVTVEEAVIAINKLSTGAANQNATIGNINSNVDAIVDQLTWGTF